MGQRGGDRSAAAKANGKKMGRRKKEPLPKVRRDVAYEVLEVLNLPDDEQEKARKKCSGEARLILKFVLDATDSRLRWDAYRYNKECVDGKPLVRAEDKIIFDPNQPLRVLVEHIGTTHPAAAKAK
jgi:hypothetical protein